VFVEQFYLRQADKNQFCSFMADNTIPTLMIKCTTTCMFVTQSYHCTAWNKTPGNSSRLHAYN